MQLECPYCKRKAEYESVHGLRILCVVCKHCYKSFSVDIFKLGCVSCADD